jgi:hypothetical protein
MYPKGARLLKSTRILLGDRHLAKFSCGKWVDLGGACVWPSFVDNNGTGPYVSMGRRDRQLRAFLRCFHTLFRDAMTVAGPIPVSIAGRTRQCS